MKSEKISKVELCKVKAGGTDEEAASELGTIVGQAVCTVVKNRICTLSPNCPDRSPSCIRNMN